MSIIDVDELFDYVFPTSSLEYIRNYNFNSATVTDLPLSLINRGSDIPITVNITTQEPWIQVVDSVNGNNLKYPSGNVVLAPTSSRVVLVKVDLPSEIEEASGSITIRPNIFLDIKSGSFPIVAPTSGDTNTGIVVNQDIIFLNVNESTELEFTIYDENGIPDFSVGFDEVQLDIDNLVASADYGQGFVISYSPITIRGIAAGETTLNISARGFTTGVTVRVRGESSSGSGTNSGPPGPLDEDNDGNTGFN
jgi:hypothetical protein